MKNGKKKRDLYLTVGIHLLLAVDDVIELNVRSYGLQSHVHNFSQQLGRTFSLQSDCNRKRR